MKRPQPTEGPGPHPAATESFYQNLWSDANWGGQEANYDERCRVRSILNLLGKHSILPGPTTPLRILDVGSGRGWLTSRLAPYGSVTGIEPVQAAVERARVLFPSLTFEVGTTTDLVARGEIGRYDLIVCSEVIEHVEDGAKHEFLASFCALLRPGGHAIITTPRGELWAQWKDLNLEEQPVEQWIAEAALDELAHRLGFEVVGRDRVYLPGLWPAALDHALANGILRRALAVPGLSSLFAGYRFRRAIYQVALLRRPGSPTASHV